MKPWRNLQSTTMPTAAKPTDTSEMASQAFGTSPITRQGGGMLTYAYKKWPVYDVLLFSHDSYNLHDELVPWMEIFMMSTLFKSQIQVAFYLKNRIAVLPGDRPRHWLNRQQQQNCVVQVRWMVKSQSSMIFGWLNHVESSKHHVWIVTIQQSSHHKPIHYYPQFKICCIGCNMFQPYYGSIGFWMVQSRFFLQIVPCIRSLAPPLGRYSSSGNGWEPPQMEALPWEQIIFRRDLTDIEYEPTIDHVQCVFSPWMPVFDIISIPYHTISTFCMSMVNLKRRNGS